MKKRGLIAKLAIVLVTLIFVTIGAVYATSAQETRPSGTVTSGWFISPDALGPSEAQEPCPADRSYVFVLRVVENNNPANSQWITVCVPEDDVPSFELVTFEP